MTTAQSARSMRRRGSSRDGKNDALAELGDVQLDVAGLGRQQPGAGAVAVGRALVGPLVAGGADGLARLELDELLERRGASPRGATSMPPPARMASSSSDRADCDRAIGDLLVILARNTLRITPVAPSRAASARSGAPLKSHHSGGHHSASDNDA